jgi:predicted RNA binding protein YcfA (HicA-like mRNA interferase family)
MSDRQLPLLRPAQLTRALEKMGFIVTRRSRGSHLRYAHPDGRKTTVPMHEGKTIGRGLLRKILRDVQITPEELKSHL